MARGWESKSVEEQQSAASTQVESKQRLTPQQAALGYPVRIVGVITGTIPTYDFFIQDATAGIYVEGNPPQLPSHHFGYIAEVIGVTGAGQFAPVIREGTTRLLGKGPLPPSHLFTMSEIATGVTCPRAVLFHESGKATAIVTKNAIRSFCFRMIAPFRETIQSVLVATTCSDDLLSTILFPWVCSHLHGQATESLRTES